MATEDNIKKITRLVEKYICKDNPLDYRTDVRNHRLRSSNIDYSGMESSSSSSIRKSLPHSSSDAVVDAGMEEDSDASGDAEVVNPEAEDSDASGDAEVEDADVENSDASGDAEVEDADAGDSDASSDAEVAEIENSDAAGDTEMEVSDAQGDERMESSDDGVAAVIQDSSKKKLGKRTLTAENTNVDSEEGHSPKRTKETRENTVHVIAYPVMDIEVSPITN